MPITLLDGIVVGFTLVSALLAMVRGFSREILSIASWVAAAAAAFYFHPIVLPYVTPYVDHPMVSLAVASAVIFFIALIVVTVITMKIADFIIDSKVGALDRTLGFIYGAGRGVLVLAVALLFFNWLVGTNPPAWVTDAKSRPMLESIGEWVQGILPDDPENSILNRLRGQEGDPDQPSPDAPAQPAPPAQPPISDDDIPAEEEFPAEDDVPAEE